MDTIKCPNCGAEIAPNAHFCQFCGATVTSQTPPPYANTQTPPPPYTGQPGGQPVYGRYTQNGAWQGAPVPTGYQQKSKIAAGIIAIFIGCFGIHNFYLGYTNKALIQLLVSLIGGAVTCGIATFAMWVWGLIEGIQILTGSINVDAAGVPLGD